ncbi:hypothetical protein [Winogradskyella ursingii]|uniref:hypothetical protein n=1 Tax=Winogradskyella ursingii TaxID=2686079 RepID=UPI0015CD0620|nr:hypothetical protein [Winogradskyella ursingii]
MNTITRIAVFLMISLVTVNVQGQEKKIDSTSVAEISYEIEILQKEKQKIEAEEREALKKEISAINRRLDQKEITAAQAEELKKEAAKKRAANIENRLAIIDNKIALLVRNKDNKVGNNNYGDSFVIRIGGSEDHSDSFIYLGKRSDDKPRIYDRRTTTDVVFAIGFNNTLIDGQSIDDSPYKLGGSGFVELGYAWKTRVFDNSNFLRLKYGFSIHWNKLDIKDNNYFVNNDGDITLEEFPLDLKKAKFRTTNLVFPLHFEFGPSEKIERDTYFRYSTRKKFKMGLGGYAGINLAHRQKLKYSEDGNREKDKQRGGFNVNEFIYGLSGYVAFGDTAVYVKYDLNPLFKDQAIEQNTISVGLRFDMD